MKNELQLPNRFVEEMREMPGLDLTAFLASYEEESRRGLRINTGKVSLEEWNRISPFETTPVPWIENGFFYHEKDMPAKDVYYYAGLYYLQEPSAMTPADRLPVEVGDRVLDLCAAPGGKATALGAKLGKSGCLVANDISATRAAALLRNLERAGIGSCVVTAETPQKLAQAFPAYFDKILVDAPCSGEGMFRREPSMIDSWLQKESGFYAPLQRKILSEAAKMLKPGGLLLYSTCTFSILENEENVRFLTEAYGFMPVEMKPYAGFAPGIGYPQCVRIWPHLMEGDGHFLALLRKPGDHDDVKLRERQSAAEVSNRTDGPAMLQRSDFAEFMEQCSFSLKNRSFFVHRDSVYLLPDGFANPSGVRILRSGLLLGTLKGERFTPSQAFAMTLTPSQYEDTVSLTRSDGRVRKYLKGETIELDAAAKGWQLVCVDGFPLGWGKAAQSTLKNKIDPGWRMG